MKPMTEGIFMCDCYNVLTALYSNKSESSLKVQNVCTPPFGQIATPLIGKSTKLKSLNTNIPLCANKFERLAKPKLKPVFIKPVSTVSDKVDRNDSEEINIRLFKLLSLRSEIHTGSGKVSKGRKSSRRDSKISSVSIKSPESQHSIYPDQTMSSNQKPLQLTSYYLPCSQSLKGAPTNKSSILILSEQEESLSNSRLSDGAKNYKSLPGTMKRKRRNVLKNQHKIYTFDISNFTKSMYPGNCICHRNCVDSAIIVPKNMGWLWNITDDATGYQPRPTWRPGAIPKSVSKIIKQLSTTSHTEVPDQFVPHSKRKIKSLGHSAPHTEDFGSDLVSGLKPLLHLHETKGVYCVNMHPLHEDYQNKRDPIHFKIRKCSDNEDLSSSELSLEINVIVPDEPCVKSEQMKENSEENLNHKEEIKVDTPAQKKDMKKKGTAKQRVKQGPKK